MKCFRYQFFLQLKQDLLTGRLECPYATSIEFAAASLQCKPSQLPFCLDHFLLRMKKAGLRISNRFIRIRIQHFRLNTDPDPIRIQGFNDQKLKQKLQLKKFNFFGSKNYNLPIPRPP
jgi:hypothetical protein